MTDPSGGTYAFEYDGPGVPAGANDLTKVIDSPAARRACISTPSRPTSTAARPASAPSAPAWAQSGSSPASTDENGVRFATWTYDCPGSRHGSGMRLGGTYAFAYGDARGDRPPS